MTKIEVHEWDGSKIASPGFYNIPIQVYHSDCCDGPSVSSSGLRTIANETPLHFWDRSYLNPNRDPDDVAEFEADHFRFGRACHWRLLEPELFNKHIAVRYDALFDSWRTKASQEWRTNAQREGYTVLTEAELKRVDAAAAALRRHPAYEQGLIGGGVEISMIVKDAKTGIWIKSRPDAMPIAEALTDLKFMQSARPDDVNRAISKLGYDMQMALGGIAYEKLAGQTIDTFWIVAVEATRPHAVHIARVGDVAHHWARIKLRKALDTMRTCLDSGDWPAYDEDGRAAEPSKWEVETLTEAQKHGLLPQEAGF